jgi:hypothetical protein
MLWRSAGVAFGLLVVAADDVAPPGAGHRLGAVVDLMVTPGRRQKCRSWHASTIIATARAQMMIDGLPVQIVKSLHHALAWHFWLSWPILSAAVVIGSTWFVSRSSAPRSQPPAQTKLIPVRRRVATPANIMALGVLAAFLVAYIAMTLVWEDFAYYDNGTFFALVTLKGHDIAPPIWPAQGRFFPLGLQEFNLIRHFTDSAIGYHALPTAELLIFVSVLLVLDDGLGIAARSALAILALLTPSILTSFGGLIYPERNELLFLAGLIFCVKRFDETEATAWAAGTVVCAQIMIYYKETAFLLLLGFAGARLLLRCGSGRPAGWDYHRLLDRPARLDWSLVGVSILFLLYYLGAMGLHHNMNFAREQQLPFLTILLGYTRLDPLAWVLVIVAAARLYLVLRRRAPLLPLWDGLAVGGVAYLLAYVYLRLFSVYYLAPVDLIALLYAGRFAVLSWEKAHFLRRSIVFVLVFIVVFPNLLLSVVKIYQRKNVIHGKVEIAGVIAKQYRVRMGHPLRLFFPFAEPYIIMEFAGYLSYLGIPVEGADGAATGAGSVALFSQTVAKDGRCMSYQTIRCHAALRPVPGDLVIVLPDDQASRAEASLYRVGGELFYYEPRPAMPGWLLAQVGDVVGGDPEMATPDRWMDGSVVLWR